MKLSVQLLKLKNLYHELLKKPNLILLGLVLIFCAIRIYNLELVLNFSMEQGQVLLRAKELWNHKQLTLIGFETSLKTQSGRGFFQGPWIYYWPMPALVLGNWHPLSASYFFIIFNLLSLIILFKVVKDNFGIRPAIFTGILVSLTPQMVYFSQFVWSPNFLTTISSLLIYFWLKLKSKKFIHFFISGIILGFGLGNHYQYFIIISVFFLWMLFKKLPFKFFVITLLGLSVSFSPLIIFELRHSFYNLKTILIILNEKGASNLKFPFPFYYFLSSIPFIFIAVSVYLDKLIYKTKIAYIILFGFLVYSLATLLPKPDSGFTMTSGWNYYNLVKVSNTILRENKKNYNIANLLSGDTRNYSLRYLLAISKNPPLKVEEYPSATYLFVVSPHNILTTIKNPVWEISSFCPCEVTKSWLIQNNIYLYLLEKKPLQSL